MESTNHTRVLKLIQELAKANEITALEKDQLKGKGNSFFPLKKHIYSRETHE
jgi:hypothetical protein